jgi:mannitol-specific phosphotransferase system IIBC component
MSPASFCRSLLVGVVMTAGLAAGQPREIIVQAANTPTGQPTSAPLPVTSAKPESSVGAVIKILKEMQAEDAETLKKQNALMQALEDMEKQSNEIKAYVHRS